MSLFPKIKIGKNKKFKKKVEYPFKGTNLGSYMWGRLSANHFSLLFN